LVYKYGGEGGMNLPLLSQPLSNMREREREKKKRRGRSERSKINIWISV